MKTIRRNRVYAGKMPDGTPFTIEAPPNRASKFKWGLCQKSGLRGWKCRYTIGGSVNSTKRAMRRMEDEFGVSDLVAVALVDMGEVC